MSRSRSFFILISGFCIVGPSAAFAQDPSDHETPCTARLLLPEAALSGVYADYARAAELAGAAPLRPWLIRRATNQREIPLCADRPASPWEERLPVDTVAPGARTLRIGLLAPGTVLHANSAYPTDRNDGALWRGRGLSASVRAGVEARWDLGWGVVSATLAPMFLFQENRDFEVRAVDLAGYSPFVYPWHAGRIDWPQRFGDQAFTSFDWGQSQLRLDVRGWTVGISTENLWWGPAAHYPLLMSNTAPGFPHVFVGTARPLSTPIGKMEAQLIWGWLRESDHFDYVSANDRRLLASLVASYEPRWLPGLFLGAARSFLTYIPEEGFGLADYFERPYTRIRDNPVGTNHAMADNQLFSIFGRWAFPEVGFEVYAEWGREDHWDDWDDLIMEPDHSRAYMLGFQKVVPSGPRWVRLYGELVHLQTSSTYRSGRGGPIVMYTHYQLRQGYTHRGQLLGSSTGPGSDAQILGADVFGRWGMIGLFVERVLRDNDAYYQTWARYYGYRGHDVELTAGIRHQFFDGDFQIGWGLAYATRKNRNFIGLDGYSPGMRVDTNWSLELAVSWSPGPRPAPREAPVSARPASR